jgi:ADP-ribosylglycohydrolase
MRTFCLFDRGRRNPSHPDTAGSCTPSECSVARRHASGLRWCAREAGNTEAMSRHEDRDRFLQDSLDGLSVGDAFGERFFGPREEVVDSIARRELPSPPWRFTDDTAMAVSIVEVLRSHGEIDPDHLARAFARRYLIDPMRGYGGCAHRILGEIAAGRDWRGPSSEAFDGHGSKGNGGSMRAGPIGAYFHDNPQRVVEESIKSARITHWHPEGQAGAIAVALAVSWACMRRLGGPDIDVREYVLNHMPGSAARDGIDRARRIDLSESPGVAAQILGAGENILAEDTVPFCMWMAARHPDDYEEALWATVSALGDRDTTCAIVGSIVAVSAGEHAVPGAWLSAREPLSSLA